jgi:hypothetical protein
MWRWSLLFGWLALVCGGSAYGGLGSGVPLSESTIERALEQGCSLVVAEVLSVRSEGRMYYYRVRVARTFVAGDLQKEEVHQPLELFAGASYGGALETGCHYAMFVSREYPYNFSWAFRDDAFEIDPSNEQAVRRLADAASRIYAKTSILQFRRAAIERNVELPPLSEELVSLCKEFRQGPGRRAELGKRIFQSDLGSRIDESNPESSVRTYLPPRISCSRAQILSLLGHPNFKSGWVYSWRCDDYARARDGAGDVAVLVVRFDREDRAVRVLYYMQQRSHWIRRRTTADRLAEQEGDPAGVARGFQEALRDGDWDRALSFCSQAVRDAARGCDSSEAFFVHTVPVKKVVGHKFRPHMFSSRDGRTTRMADEVSLDLSPDDGWTRWTWALAKVGQSWKVDFEPISLRRYVQKERVKKEFQERGQQTGREAFDAAIRYVLRPTTDEFVLGQPMLFRLEMQNVGEIPIAFYRFDLMVNDPMIATDPNGRILPYVDTDYSIDLGPDAILPGETIAVADGYDVTSQYRLVQPGPYTFQFKSDRRRSNICAVDVKPGLIPIREQVVDTLLPALPAGWRWRRSVSSPVGLDGAGPVKSLYIRLSGKPGGKANRYGLTLLVQIGGEPAETDPWLREWFDFWGLSPWGPIYARVNEVESLWPDYRQAIVKALDIAAPPSAVAP